MVMKCLRIAFVGLLCLALALLSLPLSVCADSTESEQGRHPDACTADLCDMQGVLPAEYHENGLLINIPGRYLVVIQQGEVLRRYPIAAGSPQTPTPQGQFEVINAVRDPWWYPNDRQPVPAGPDNPLGPWWLGLNLRGYGIHGNNNPSSIGSLVSQGCIRMANPDIAELVELVERGTVVNIVYETVTPVPVADGEEIEWHLGVYTDDYGRDNSSVYSRVDDLLKDSGLYLPPESMVALQQVQQEADSSVSLEVPLGYLPADAKEWAFSEGLPWFFNGNLMTSPAVLRGDDELHVPLGEFLQPLCELTGEFPDIEVTVQDTEKVKKPIVCQIKGKSLISLDSSEEISWSALSEQAESDGDTHQDPDKAPSLTATVRLSDSPGLSVFSERDVKLHGILYRDEVYVPFFDAVGEMNVAADSTELGAWYRATTLYLSEQLVAVFPPFPGDESGRIPASVLKDVFGRRIIVRDDKVAFLRNTLQDVEWIDQQPWISAEEVADIIGWDSEVSEVSIKLLPR